MKKIYLVCIFVVWFIVLCWAFSVAHADTRVTMSWDANPITDVPLGYKVYDNMSFLDTVTGTSYVFTAADGDHSFTIICFNMNGDSIHSLSANRTYHTAVPGQPSNFLVEDEVTIP